MEARRYPIWGRLYPRSSGHDDEQRRQHDQNRASIGPHDETAPTSTSQMVARRRGFGNPSRGVARLRLLEQLQTDLKRMEPESVGAESRLPGSKIRRVHCRRGVRVWSTAMLDGFSHARPAMSTGIFKRERSRPPLDSFLTGPV